MTSGSEEQQEASFETRLESGDDRPLNRSGNTPIGEILARRYGRRDVLKAGLAAPVIAALTNPLLSSIEAAAAEQGAFDLAGTEHGVSRGSAISSDHEAQVLLSWGDPLFPDVPDFHPLNQTAEKQARQFGYNNDYIAYFPLPKGSASSARGLLCINHEYANPEMMFPGLARPRPATFLAEFSQAHSDIEMAAHGITVIEVAREDNGRWRPVTDGEFNRRITATTPMDISGPAAGHRRMRTKADPSGKRVLGTINNCAGGKTPWGTYLTAEENFNFYFAGDATGHREERNYRRFGIGLYGTLYAWSRFYPRFDLTAEPNEANRFGWIVEVDPFDPASTPVKRTALGRFKHEGAETIVNPKDGRLVVYMGDDQRFDYVYRFVSDRRVSTDPAANRDLLDTGRLTVARFTEDGLEWLPLVYGYGPLRPANDFHSQADVLIETRRAADLLGATPMDRPEDVQPNPERGTVYVMLTNNSRRPDIGVDAANTRPKNRYGHIIELTPPDGDHAADRFDWTMLVKCGPMGKKGSTWNALTDPQGGWFANPDNCVVDGRGRLWVATDQSSGFARTGTCDGIWALETEGERRATGHQLFRAPVGAEVTGPAFTPDDETLFIAVQHPGVDVHRDYDAGEEGVMHAYPTFDNPVTRWPAEMDSDMPPRPSVVAITRKGGGKVG